MQRSLVHRLQHHLALRVLCSGHVPGVPPAPPSPATSTHGHQAAPGVHGANLPWPQLGSPGAVSVPLGDIQPSHAGTPRERPGHYQGEFFSSGSPRKAA